MLNGTGPWHTIFVCIGELIHNYRLNDSIVRGHQPPAPVFEDEVMKFLFAILLVTSFYFLFRENFEHNARMREYRSRVTEPSHRFRQYRPEQLHPVDGPLPDELCIVCQDNGDETEDWVTIEGCNRHSFHRACVAQFRGRTCMVCRAPLGRPAPNK